MVDALEGYKLIRRWKNNQKRLSYYCIATKQETAKAFPRAISAKCDLKTYFGFSIPI